MTDTSTRIAGPKPPTIQPGDLMMFCSTEVPPGTPLAQSTTVDSTLVPARANAATTLAVCLAVSAGGERGDDGFPCQARQNGGVTLTAAEWDAVAGTTGGLAPGVPYYVSAATAGKLTSTAPSTNGQFRQPVGTALNETTLLLNILPSPVAISG